MQVLRRAMTEIEQVRAAFLPASTALPPLVPEAGLRAALLRRMDHDVVRRRSALIVHVQRLLLYLQERDAEGVLGALLDLFIVLGAHGRDLRKAMLARTRALLGAEQAAFFASRLDAGVGEFDIVPDAPASRLARGMCGRIALVARAEVGFAADPDSFALAERYLHDGQVSEAVEVLEALLQAQPGRGDAAGLLLDIYRRGRLDERFLALLPRMRDAPDAVREAWEAYARELRGAQGGAA
jgi:hypothetical protein